MSELTEAKDSGSPENIRYPLAPTLFAIMPAWLCGFDSAGKAELFWDINLENLKKLIPNFPDHRISCDTINRILSLITADDLKDILSRFSRVLTEQ
ncbi:transposase family protein [Succinimonas sp.]|uniref:transposase family protein n=1 Tax=Succinimonas sp. TaxID=1936151 RepID=UPI00386B466A